MSTSRKIHYFVVDVFGRGDEKFVGNPLAVITNGDSVSSGEMLSIAREFNFSETTFIQSPSRDDCTAAVRIFTTVRELPFAGHPTLGTAFVLSHIGRGKRLVLQETVGPVVVDVSEDSSLCTLRLAKLPSRIPEEAELDLDEIGDSFGIMPEEAKSVELWTTGPCFTIVEVTLNTLQSLKPDIGRLESTCGDRFPYIVAQQGEIWRVRVFAPNESVLEDPATGSAAGALAGWMHARGLFQNGWNHYVVHQGEEMGRPSELIVDVDVQQGSVKEVRITGKVVLVMEGDIYL